MPEHLTDFVITKVYEPKKDGELIEGTNKHGDWKLYNFHTDKTGTQKFDFMWSGKKPRPTKGLKIKHMEYEKEQKGQYTNLNVKKLEVSASIKEDISPGSLPQPKPTNGGDKEVSYWCRYITDIGIAIITSGGNLETVDLDTIAKRIGKAGLIMMNASLANTQNTPSESPEWVKGASKIPVPDLTPNNEVLSTKLQNYALLDKKQYFKILKQHGATRASEVYEFTTDAQVSLLNNLEKELGDIPF